MDFSNTNFGFQQSKTLFSGLSQDKVIFTEPASNHFGFSQAQVPTTASFEFGQNPFGVPQPQVPTFDFGQNPFGVPQPQVPTFEFGQNPFGVPTFNSSQQPFGFSQETPKPIVKRRCPKMLPQILFSKSWSYHLCGRGCPGHDRVLIRRRGALRVHYWVNEHERYSKGVTMTIRGHYRIKK